MLSDTLEVMTNHFGLTKRPFSLLPDPEFLFWSRTCQTAFSVLEYGLMTQAPITVVTGEIGSGKTTLVHHLTGILGSDVSVALVPVAGENCAHLLHWIHQALGLPVDAQDTHADLHGRFIDHLIAEYAEGRHVVLIFDEAQNLSRSALEELRILTNINSGKDHLLQLILFGQPELREMIKRPDMQQFAQRVCATSHLAAMDLNTTRSYMLHRLKVAGATKSVFSMPAADLIHQVAGGIPRRVNQLSELAMVYAFAKGDARVVRQTVLDLLDDGILLGLTRDTGLPLLLAA